MSQIQTITSTEEDIFLASLPPTKAYSSSPKQLTPSSTADPSTLERRLPHASAPSSLRSQTTAQTHTIPQNESRPPPSKTPHLRIISCILAFFTAGLNDGSLGPLLPYIFRHYALPPSSAAYLYIASFGGWLLISATNAHINSYLGLRGTLLLGAALQILAQALRGWLPPYALLAVSFGVASTGQAVQDSAANSFVAGSVGKGAHRWLGAVHASYGAGGMVGGLVAAAVAGGGESWWARFYWVVLAIGVVNAGLVAWSFRAYVDEEVDDAEGEVGDAAQGRSGKAMKGLIGAAKNKTVWTLSLFYFFHLGVVITVGGWLVEFLVTVRDAPLAQFSYVSTGLWGGLTLGRLVLAEPTHRYGERKMLLIFSACALVLEIIFWQVRNAIVDSVMAATMGFVLAPFFAAGMSVATRLLPKSLHASGLGIIFVVAQAGGTLFPAITGVIANKAGVEVLQPILVGLIVAMGVSWAFVPRVDRRDE